MNISSSLNKTSVKYSIWFLKCLLCFNNLAKIGHAIHII